MSRVPTSYKCTRRVASICEYLQVLTGTHRYLQVHEGEKGPKQPKVCLFFNLHLIFYFLYYYEAHKGPQQPTTANAGQRRSTHPTSASICPPQPPTSHDDSLVVSLASTCPPPPPTSHDDSLVASSASTCPPRPPTSHDDSLVVSSASTCPPPPPTSHDDSLVASSASTCPPQRGIHGLGVMGMCQTAYCVCLCLWPPSILLARRHHLLSSISIPLPFSHSSRTFRC